jgi:hypothetical protein
VAPGLFAQEGRCWRMVHRNVAGHGTHCMEPVAWVGRWKFLDGWTKVWSCERHADELPWARRIRPAPAITSALRSAQSLRSSEPNPGRLGAAEVGGNPDG